MNVYGRYDNYIPKEIEHIVGKIPVAKCDRKYNKGDIIIVETRRGGSHQCIVWNYLGERNGKSFYSITRADGFNAKKRIENKIEKTKQYQDNAAERSVKHSELSNRDRDFLSLGEPIKVGHHSEKRHRKIIKYACNQADKALEESRKAKRYDYKIENLKSRINNIDLSTPESLEYYKKKLHKATILYEGIKKGNITHQESADGNFSKIGYFSFYWAKRRQKELTEKYRLAKKLWGTDFINNDSSSYKIAKKCGKNLNYHKFITDRKEITQEFLETLAA